MRVNTKGSVQESHIMYHEHTGKQGLSIPLIANIEINDIKTFFVLDESGEKIMYCLSFISRKHYFLSRAQCNEYFYSNKTMMQ